MEENQGVRTYDEEISSVSFEEEEPPRKEYDREYPQQNIRIQLETEQFPRLGYAGALKEKNL